MSKLDVFDVVEPDPREVQRKKDQENVVDGKLGSLDVFDVTDKEEEKTDDLQDSLLEDAVSNKVESPIEMLSSDSSEEVVEYDAEKARRMARELLEETGEAFESLPVKRSGDAKKKGKKREVSFDDADGSSDDEKKDEFEEFPGQKKV
jgi:hypothetical protein